MENISVAWSSKVTEEFLRKVFDICKGFGWPVGTHASWLMSCMAFETDETFSPSVLNGAGSKAVGLIQFMPRTAEGLGTSSAALANMTAVEQLEYVRLYFKPYAKKIFTLSDMYMAILMPSFVGKAEESVLFTSPSVAYTQNKGLDLNKDGKITKGEASSIVAAKLRRGFSFVR